MSTTSTSLADALAGEVLLPGTDAYDRARSVWNAMVDRRPAAIVRPTTAKEVAQAVTVARDRGLAIGVRCGGHSVTGLAVPEGGLMIDLTAMSGSRVDPERRRAWIGGGAKLGVLDRATEPFGLATTAGNVSHTGVGGLTLGGGMGWLARRLGLSCDNVEAYEVVTADGSVVRASADERPDLFWGLRGGGGNFGIVTEFEFRLHPLAGRTLLVELDVALEHARDAFRAWNALIAEAPREATLTGWAGRNADGSPRIILGYAWVGDPEAGRGYLARFRDIGPATAESVSELSYVELQSMDDVPAGPGRRRYWKGHYLREMGDAAIDAFLSVATAGYGTLHGGLQTYGGAIGDVSDDDSAFSQRDAVVEFVASTGWDDPAEDAAQLAAARAYGAALEPFSSGVYVNALADEGAVGVQRAYRPEKLARLTALKDVYDPDNLFRQNHNIRPSADVSGPSSS